MLRLALSSNLDWQEPTLAFLESCGLGILRSNARRYTGSIASLPGTAVLFQRTAEIPAKVEEGVVDLGIAGLDQFYEVHAQHGKGMVLIEDLGFRKADLVVAVPESWLDVASLADVADVAMEFNEKGKRLRVATKYPRLTERFLLSRNINRFVIVESGGTLEAAPAMGYADIIVDITSSGTTLRENQLKTIEDGTVFSAQACLIGNTDRLARDPETLATARIFLEMVEARLRASGYYSIIANIRGSSPEEVAGYIQQKAEIAGIEGPTVSPVYSRSGSRGWYAVTMVVDRGKVMTAVEHLRKLGGNGITVSPTTYVFEAECLAYDRLLTRLGRAPAHEKAE